MGAKWSGIKALETKVDVMKGHRGASARRESEVDRGASARRKYKTNAVFFKKKTK